MQTSIAVPLMQPPTDLLMQASDGLRLRRSTADGNNDAELKRVSQEFESLFVAYLLKVMRETIEESGLAEGGFGKSIYTDLFDQEFARGIARQGALGISDLLIKRLAAEAPENPAGDEKPKPVNGKPMEPAASNAHSNLERPVEAGLDEDIPCFQRPLSAPVSSSFGMRKDPFTHRMRFHKGLDLAAPAGTQVRAAMAGQVVFAGYQNGYGNTVVLEHPGGVQTRYAHLGSIEVSKGDAIDAKQVLGSVGNTGRSTGPHLHFEFGRSGVQADPTGSLGD